MTDIDSLKEDERVRLHEENERLREENASLREEKHESTWPEAAIFIALFIMIGAMAVAHTVMGR